PAFSSHHSRDKISAQFSTLLREKSVRGHSFFQKPGSAPATQAKATQQAIVRKRKPMASSKAEGPQDAMGQTLGIARSRRLHPYSSMVTLPM
ncbi:hypothetical protein, partial [Vannielia sp.]|uniref:hypothetical protein n=1 Tax=Vannielia sp. TaxID=2813045 RepID=UPI002617F2A5